MGTKINKNRTINKKTNNMNDEKIRCPKCGSDNIYAYKKGFSTGRAVAGTVVGGIYAGALVGGIGSNKIEITCLSCGKKFKPGEQLKEKTEAIIEIQTKDGYVKPIQKQDSITTYKLYKCHNCGRIASANKYCPSCGAFYNESDLYTNDMQTKKGCLGIFIAIIVTSFLLTIL
jgi:DNA-directed RNA polymerase subunit RPC12/RpoP